MNPVEMQRERDKLKKPALDMIKQLRTSENLSATSRKVMTGLLERNVLPEYWSRALLRDMPNVPEGKRNEIVSNLKKFIICGKQKGYFTDENILDVYEQMVCGIDTFRLLPRGAVFGEWTGIRGNGSLALDVSNSGDFFKHIIFHEMCHSLTRDIGVSGPRSDGAYCFGSDMNSWTFMQEFIAEGMACDLDDSFKPSKTEVYPGTGLLSDWVTPWNRAYQHIGETFLSTLTFITGKSNREKTRELAKMALDPENRLCSQIDETYERKDRVNGRDDLKRMSKMFEKLLRHTEPTTQEIQAFNGLISQYISFKPVEPTTPKITFTNPEQLRRARQSSTPRITFNNPAQLNNRQNGTGNKNFVIKRRPDDKTK